MDAPSTEYACDQGWGEASQPLTLATANAIAAWHANAVRVPLNEDCWLGLNGQPSFGTQAGYQQAIETWVTDLNAAGLYAVLDLHWTAPGTHDADGQRPMPDDHSAAFWSSVAGAFESNHAVVFDAFNEPYSPAGNGNSSLAVSWSCWLNGGCPVPVANQNDTINDSDTYSAVGMQAMVNAIRSTGATQPILLGGLSYANDLSGWLAHEPVDPDHQLAASFHNYFGESCDTTSCWNTTIASVAAQVPGRDRRIRPGVRLRRPADLTVGPDRLRQHLHELGRCRRGQLPRLGVVGPREHVHAVQRTSVTPETITP